MVSVIVHSALSCLRVGGGSKAVALTLSYSAGMMCKLFHVDNAFLLRVGFCPTVCKAQTLSHQALVGVFLLCILTHLG